MMRLVFNNGDIIDCQTIERIYVEGHELNKIAVVDKLEQSMFEKGQKEVDQFVSAHYSGSEETE